ncbi:hypothetical protein QTN25_005473 [Entamoeba marina]
MSLPHEHHNPPKNIVDVTANDDTHGINRSNDIPIEKSSVEWADGFDGSWNETPSSLVIGSTLSESIPGVTETVENSWQPTLSDFKNDDMNEIEISQSKTNSEREEIKQEDTGSTNSQQKELPTQVKSKTKATKVMVVKMKQKPKESGGKIIVENTESKDRKSRYSVKVHKIKASPIQIKIGKHHGSSDQQNSSSVSMNNPRSLQKLDTRGNGPYDVMEQSTRYHHSVEQDTEIITKFDEENLQNQLNALEFDKEENLRKGVINSYLPQLQQWTGHSHYRIIYNSKVDGMSTDTFNNRVCLKKKVMIMIFTTDGNLFGSYHSKRIPPTGGEGFVCDDSNHFVFTLRNPFNVPPTKFVRRNTSGPSLGINFTGFKSLDNESVLVTSRWCYYIRENESNISMSFSSVYADTVGKDYFIFTGSTVIKLDLVIALEWDAI